MSPVWLKPRRYRHFDLPINEAFAKKITDPAFVIKHAFSPLIHYNKSEKRYKKRPEDGKRVIEVKNRPIKYASHRDACILSYYSFQLVRALEQKYRSVEFGESVIAYRGIGKSNYDFAAEAYRFAVDNAPVMILAFDVTGFFDNLDHRFLKKRLKTILEKDDLPKDWYKIFKYITDFHFVDMQDLANNPVFGPRIKDRNCRVIGTVAEIKSESILFRANPEIEKGFRRGIPQGTPISSAMSNLYMIDFDEKIYDICRNKGAMYRRYSDDILIICKPSEASFFEGVLNDLFDEEKLQISNHKTEKNLFGTEIVPSTLTRSAQYLGFSLGADGAMIRESSLSRQWRKMRRAIRRARKASELRTKSGNSSIAFTKKLYRRFSLVSVNDGKSIRALRSFSSYGRRSANAFGANEKIKRQIVRFERAAIAEISALKSLGASARPDEK